MFSIQPLSKAHNVKEFDCGVPALNDWLRKTAKQHQEKGISRTYVIVKDEAPEVVVGYYAITICEVHGEDLPPELAKKLPRHVPAFRLGRLATAVPFQRNKDFRIGESLLVDAMSRAKALSVQAGGFALFVDAKDEGAAAFYGKYGFASLPDNPLTMLIPMASIPD